IHGLLVRPPSQEGIEGAGIDMDDKLRSALASITPPPVHEGARRAALAASMAAFDAEQRGKMAEAEKNSSSLQGSAGAGRLRSIASIIEGIWKMDLRIPLGATFAAILVVPLGVAIMNQTALSPLDKVFDRWRGPESG